MARKHYSHSLGINKHLNVRAYMGLLACTKAIAAHRSYKPDADDGGLNDRVQQFALAYLTQHYAANAPVEIAAAGASSSFASSWRRLLSVAHSLPSVVCTCSRHCVQGLLSGSIRRRRQELEVRRDAVDIDGVLRRRSGMHAGLHLSTALSGLF